MELTGQCNKDFREWWYENITDEYSSEYLSAFNEEPKAMQFGVIQDFADSKGVCIEICMTPTLGNFYFMIDDSSEADMFNTRPEARAEAIKQFNKQYNKDNG